MNVIETHPIQYLTPEGPSFWGWETGLVVFDSGETLTFREELHAVIEHLQPYGLPPIEGLLLFLAATRDRWASDADALWRECQKPYEPSRLDCHLPTGWRERVLEELSKVSRLQSSWRRDLRRKCLLAEVCFERSELLLDPDQARGVADLLELGFVPPALERRADSEESVRRFARGLRPWLEGMPVLDEGRLERRLRTGVDIELSAANQVDLSLVTQMRSLLVELEDDPEWAGLARLARNLMAAVHVPRALGDRDDLPLGGFSDIANRGSLDRLLVSELAQDDLILAARLALNEALFLRRESPPSNPLQRRVLLVDNGIRLWGTPRLFAVAVGMALEAVGGNGVDVESFVPTEHQQLREVCLHTREGLIESLSHLHAHAHPGNALLELAKRCHHVDEGLPEMIVIAHADVLEDAAFLSVMDLMDQAFYLAAVDREGNYALYQCEGSRVRCLHRARLHLETLLGGEGQVAGLRRPGVPVNLPSIFHRRPFPIRLPSHRVRDRTVFTQQDGVFKSCRDGRLLHFNEPELGGVEVAVNLPPGGSVPVVEVQPLVDGRRVVAIVAKRQLFVCFVDVSSGGWDRVTIPVERTPLQLIVVHQQVLVVYARQVGLYEIKHGELLSELTFPNAVARCYGDLALLGSEWHRLSIDGMRPCLVTVDEQIVLKSSHMEEYRLRPMGGLRKQFRGISFHHGGAIVLHTTRIDHDLLLEIEPRTQILCVRPTPPLTEAVLFKPIAGPEGSRMLLKEAVWSDGSRVILDSRGLMHFVSASPEIDDFTVILTGSGPMAIWAASLGGFGDPYYFVEPPEASAAAMDHLLRQFVLRVQAPC